MPMPGKTVKGISPKRNIYPPFFNSIKEQRRGKAETEKYAGISLFQKAIAYYINNQIIKLKT